MQKIKTITAGDKYTTTHGVSVFVDHIDREAVYYRRYDTSKKRLFNNDGWFRMNIDRFLKLLNREMVNK